MKTITEIYTEYEIMPELALHQLRVAAVAKLVSENLNRSVDIPALVRACLLHDMGNIIKFDLDKAPVPLTPAEILHWKKVQSAFIEKYGPDEHHATVQIAKELGIDERTLALVRGLNFLRACEYAEGDDWEMNILLYADCRVGPGGVLPLEKRMNDFRHRYSGRNNYYAHMGDTERVESIACTHEIEKKIGQGSSVPPETIGDADIARAIRELKGVSI